MKVILAILHFLLWGPGKSDHSVLKTLKTKPANPSFLVLIRKSQSQASDSCATAIPACWDIFPSTYMNPTNFIFLPGSMDNPKFPKLCQSLSAYTHSVFFSELFVQPLKQNRGRMLSNPRDAHRLLWLLLSALDLWRCWVWAQPHTQLQRREGGKASHRARNLWNFNSYLETQLRRSQSPIY